MKKLHKIITLCLALVMLLSIMPMSANAADESIAIVWTEDEVLDLSIPRPSMEDYTMLFVIPRDRNSTELADTLFATSDTRSKYIGRIMCVVMDNTYETDGSFSDAALKGARAAYSRSTDPVWKNAIAEAFNLDIKDSNGSGNNTVAEPETPVTDTEPETPATTPEPAVTTPTTTPTTTVKVDGFTDVKPGDWYYEAVMALANSGILAGYGDGSFRPNNTITAGELATIICRIYGIDLSVPVARTRSKHNVHDDSTVNTGHWAENAINNCFYYAGRTDWRMCIADMQANRGWAVTELVGALTTATWPNGTMLSEPTWDEEKAIIAKIPDVASGNTWDGTEDPSHYANYRLTTVPEFSVVATGEEAIAHDYMTMASKYAKSTCDLTSWQAGAIAKAYHIGLVNGVDSTGRCDPWAPVTRAQVVQMLYNMGITYAGQLKPYERTNNSGLVIGFGF